MHELLAVGDRGAAERFRRWGPAIALLLQACAAHLGLRYCFLTIGNRVPARGESAAVFEAHGVGRLARDITHGHLRTITGLLYDDGPRVRLAPGGVARRTARGKSQDEQ